MAFIGILLQTFSQVVIVADYYVHKEYIAKKLCENRDRPAMHCEGKCCLKKKLAKEAKEQLPAPGNQKKAQEVTLFFEDTRQEPLFVFAINTALTFPSAPAPATAEFYHSIFHPPSA